MIGEFQLQRIVEQLFADIRSTSRIGLIPCNISAKNRNARYAFRKSRYFDQMICNLIVNVVKDEERRIKKQQILAEEVENNIYVKQIKVLLQQCYKKFNQGSYEQVSNMLNLFRYTFFRRNHHIQIERPFFMSQPKLYLSKQQLLDYFQNFQNNVPAKNSENPVLRCGKQRDCWNCINHLKKNQKIYQENYLNKGYLNYVVKKLNWDSWFHDQLEIDKIEPVVAIANTFLQKGYIYIGLKQNQSGEHKEKEYLVEGVKMDEKNEKSIKKIINKVFSGIKEIQEHCYQVEISKIMVGQKNEKKCVYRIKIFIQIQDEEEKKEIYYYFPNNSQNPLFFSHQPVNASYCQYQLKGTKIYEYFRLRRNYVKKMKDRYIGFQPINCNQAFQFTSEEPEKGQTEQQMTPQDQGHAEEQKMTPWDQGPVKKLKFESLVITTKKGEAENCIQNLKSQMKMRKIMFSMYPKIYPQLEHKSERFVYYFSHDIPESQFGQLIKNIDYFGRIMIWQSIESQIQLIDKKDNKFQIAIQQIKSVNDKFQINESIRKQIYYKKKSYAIKFEDNQKAIFYFTLLDKLKIKSNFINKKKWEDNTGDKKNDI